MALRSRPVPAPGGGEAALRGRGSGPGRPPRSRGSAGLGVLAGAIGLGCCVYPVVLVLLGISSATSAVALGTRLFTEWGWAFKLAGGAFAAAALLVQWRKARACSIDRRPRFARNAAWLIGSGLATYGVLYVVTTGLGFLAT